MTQLLRSRGVVICLFAPVETILERTARNNNRPLLNVEDREARIRALLAEREPAYMAAGTCISTQGRSIAEVVRHVARTYSREAREWDGRSGR